MIKPPRTIRALPLSAAAATLALLCASGCAVYDDSPRARGQGPARSEVYPYAEPDVVSVYVEPPLSEPPPIAVPWAPPPMLRELPPPMPFAGAIWIGGYWVWQGNWVWATGRWAVPPRPDYAWRQPYYEHRDGMVIFITGHWCPPGVAFVPPPRGMRMTVVPPSRGARRGDAPVGPPGVFLPPPPGSRPGLIVPAPMGTSPAVVRGAPPMSAAREQPNRPDLRQGAPTQYPERGDQGVPRDDGWRPARTRDRSQESPQERGQERPPMAFPRRPFQGAPVQAAPSPAPLPAPAMQPEPRRRDDRARMEAPPTRSATDNAQQQPRREEAPRRLMAPKSDKDKKDPKNE